MPLNPGNLIITVGLLNSLGNNYRLSRVLFDDGYQVITIKFELFIPDTWDFSEIE